MFEDRFINRLKTTKKTESKGLPKKYLNQWIKQLDTFSGGKKKHKCQYLNHL